MRQTIQSAALDADSPDALREVYGDWANGVGTKPYDQWAIEEGCVAPARAADLLLGNLRNLITPILDAGCGTGLVGVLLKDGGCTSIDGVDFCPEMMAQAREKGVYHSLAEADLTKELDIPSDTYGAVICVGVFTLGHVGPDALAELIRVLKPGGLLCFTVRNEAWEEYGFSDILDKYVADGMLEERFRRTSDYIQGDGAFCQLCLYRKNGEWLQPMLG